MISLVVKYTAEGETKHYTMPVNPADVEIVFVINGFGITSEKQAERIARFMGATKINNSVISIDL